MDRDSVVQQASQPLVEALGATIGNIYEAMRQEFADKEEKTVNDALARYHGDGRREDAEGAIGIDRKFWGKRAATALEDWQPMVVYGIAPGQKPDEKQIQEALNVFLGMTTLDADDDLRVLTVQQETERALETDPHAISIINTIKHYVVGPGVHFSCPVPEVNDFLKEFWANSSMNRRMKEAAPRKYAYGEHFFYYFVSPSGKCVVSDSAKAWQIEKIQVHSEDVETRMVYGQLKAGKEGFVGVGANDDERYNWMADVRYFERRKDASGWMEKASVDGRSLAKNRLVQMCKYGPTSSVRGRPQMFSVLRYLKYYNDFLLDRIVLNHERSKVIWIRKLLGNRQPGFERADYAPQGGVILNESDKIEWRTEAPNINAGDAAEDGRIIRLAVAAGVGMPEHVIFQDPSNNVYASLRKQDTPFSQAVRSHQQEWIWDLEEMFRTVKREGAAGPALKPAYDVPVYSLASEGRLLREIGPMVQQGASHSEVAEAVEKMAGEMSVETRRVATMDIPVDVDLPDIVQEDPTVQAKRAEILLRNRLVSRTTLAAEMDYNMAEEERLAQAEGGWPEPQGKAAYGQENASPDAGSTGSDSAEPSNAN